MTPARDIQIGGSHYRNESGIEPWDVIAAWDLDFWTGNCIKYIRRYREKGTPVQDLKKARHYLDYVIEREEEYAGIYRPGDDKESEDDDDP